MLRHTPLAAAIAAIMLVLTGCATTGTDLLPVNAGPGDDDLLPVTAGEGDDDLLPVEVKDPADDLLPIEVPRKGAECVPGQWVLDNASWQALVASQTAGQGATVQTPTGSVAISFAESGSYSVDYQDWEIHLQTDEGSIVMKRAGTDAGRYTVSTSSVVMTETSTGSVAQGTVQTSEGSFALPGVASKTAIAEQFGYTCEGDAMNATVPEGVLILHRE
jgi:hypothetical protein